MEECHTQAADNIKASLKRSPARQVEAGGERPLLAAPRGAWGRLRGFPSMSLDLSEHDVLAVTQT